MYLGGIWRDRADWKESFELFAAKQVNTIRGLRYTIFLEGELFEKIDDVVNVSDTLENGFGCYAYVCIDLLNDRIIVGTDKLGFSPLYYVQGRNTFQFSTDINWLKSRQESVSVDLESLEEMMNLGEILGNKTNVREIKRLGYGEKIIISKNGVTFRHFWSPELPDFMDENDYVAENNRLLAEAIDHTKNCRKNKVVFLSGGEDSRRIAAAAYKGEVEFSFVTQKGIFSRNLDNDSELAKLIAKKLNKGIHVEEVPTAMQFFDDCNFSDYFLGFESMQMGWLVPAMRSIASNCINYDGIVGDINVNGHCFRAMPDCIKHCNDNSRLADMMLEGKQLFVTKSAAESLKERVVAQLENLPDSPYKVNYYYILNHTRRKIALGAHLFKLFDCDICYPFLYYPLFIQSMSLLPENHLNKYYQNICTEEVCPELSFIPSTRRGVPTELLIDMSKEAKQRLKYFAESVYFDKFNVKKYFPEYNTRLSLFRLCSRLSFYPGVERYEWVARPLFYISNLFRWIDNKMEYNALCFGNKEKPVLRKVAIETYGIYE